MMDYADFELLITPDYMIRVSSDQGEEQGILQLRKTEIELAVNLIEHERTNASLHKSLGGNLYTALFPRDVHAHFRASQARAAAEGKGLRLRLIIEPSEISALPWEFLYEQDANVFLANNPATILSRYIPIPLPRGQISPASLPLKVFVVISDPQDLVRLNVAAELHIIREALGTSIENGQIELEILETATIRDINQKLREADFHIFHFIGHAAFVNEEGFIALTDSSGQADLVDAETFSNFFLGYPSLGLIVLNACQGASMSEHRAFSGAAAHLVRRGIPAVIAMQYPIQDATAILFSDEFYRAIASGWPVDAAAQTTRNSISLNAGLDTRDFATPVLFMRARDGVIFHGLA